jgi:ATP-dependent helicase/DNAse subunit B
MTPCTDAVAPAVSGPEQKRVTGGSAILAAQAACPFQSFAAHRLGIEPLQAEVMGLSAAERGKLLHEALYLLWGEIGDSTTLHKLDTTAQAQIVRESVAEALAALPAPLRLLAGEDCLALECQRLQSLLQEWLELEKQREPFRVVAREEERTIEFAGIPLRLRIDRIDAVAGDRGLLIDYKSGRCGLGDWLGERVRDPQLPLYGVVSEVGGICLAQVRARDCKFVGVGTMAGTPGVANDLEKVLSRYPVDAGDWDALVDHWRTDLEQLAIEFLAGRADVAPQPGACDFCAFPALCRIGLAPGGAS